jgi:hypothetical protein
MRRPILVLSVAAAAGGMALFAWSHRSSAHGSGASELEAQQRQLQALTLQVDALNASLREFKRAPPHAGDLAAQAAPSSVPANVAPLATEVPRAVQEVAMQQPVDLETEFAREPPSGAAKDAESQLAARLARVMPEGSHVEEIECRAGLCRVESSHHGVQGYREFLKATTRQASEVWQGSVRFEALPEPDNPEAEVVLIAYVSR